MLVTTKERRATTARAANADIDAHIKGFCNTFIRKEFRERWTYWLRDRPDKGRTELHKFHAHHDPRLCHITKTVDVTATRLRRQVDVDTALVFTSSMRFPEIVPIDEALERNEPYPEDAIISVVPGSVAVVFSHDGLCWICQRRREQA